MDVKERFLKYVTYYTTSNEDSETVPSTARQRVLGQALAEELAALGLQNVELDGFGYVYGVLPASPAARTCPPWASSPTWTPPPASAART